MTETGVRIRVLLSLQRALLGSVTSDLRAVAVRWTATQIFGRFVYDRNTDINERLEIIQEMETLVIADHDDHVDVQFVAESSSTDAILRLRTDEVWVFLRREE